MIEHAFRVVLILDAMDATRVNGARPEAPIWWSPDRHWQVLVELWRREDLGLPSASIRELAVVTQRSSTSTVRGLLLRLRDEGLVEWELRCARTLRLTDGGRWAVMQAMEALDSCQ